MKPSTSKFEVAVRVRGIDRKSQPYLHGKLLRTPVSGADVRHGLTLLYQWVISSGKVPYVDDP